MEVSGYDFNLSLLYFIDDFFQFQITKKKADDEEEVNQLTNLIKWKFSLK